MSENLTHFHLKIWALRPNFPKDELKMSKIRTVSFVVNIWISDARYHLKWILDAV